MREMRVSSQNARFSAKCVFRWEMHVSMRKCTFRWKNMRCALLCKNKMIGWFVAKYKLPLALENANVVENCVLCRWITKCVFRRKMCVSLQNAQYVEKEECTFHEKCLFLWKMPNISKNLSNVFRWEMHVSLHNACSGEVHDVYQC